MENKILTPELEQLFLNEGYFNLKEVNGKIYGLFKFMFTIGLMCDLKLESCFGMNLPSYEYRYCYPYEKTEECLLALKVYDGIGDPIGSWVKQKGGGIDRINPAIDDWIK